MRQYSKRMHSDEPTHFVIFMTDQHRADLLGCAGHPVLHTPHIDGIAAQGVLFERFYVANPACMPNRASIMTGRTSSVHGVRCNGLPLSTNEVTFVELLRDSGYATALIGKSHLQNYTGLAPKLARPVSDRGLREPSPALAQSRRDHLDSDIYKQEGPRDWRDPEARVTVPFYGFDHVDLVTGHGDLAEGNYLAWAQARGVDVLALRGPEQALPHEYACPQAWRTAVPESAYPSSYIAEKSIEAIDELAAQQRPFFLMVSFPDPHHPFTPPGRYWDMYKPQDMPAEHAFADAGWEAPAHVKAVWNERAEGRAQLGGFAAISVDEREAREAHALTCGMITCIDDAIGRIIDRLRRHGLIDKTVLCFTSDHGEFLGDHRLLLKGPAHFQSLIRVPFIWADPAVTHRRGARTQRMASSVDLSATVLERAGLAAPWGLQGRSLLPVIDRDAEVRQAVLVEEEQQRLCFGFDRPPRVHTLVDTRWRISVYRDSELGELYDLATDPRERTNLWDASTHVAVKAQLLARLLREQLAAVDRAPFPTSLA